MSSSTTLSFDLPEYSHLTLGIYSVTGIRVRGLLNASLSQGSHTVAWDGNNSAGNRIPPRIYLCRLSTGTGNGYCRIIKVSGDR